jgi:hypothetical protein
VLELDRITDVDPFRLNFKKMVEYGKEKRAKEAAKVVSINNNTL